MEFENVKARERDDDGNTVDNIDHFDEYGFAVFKLGSKYSACDDRIHVFRRDKTPVGVHKEWEKLFSKWMYYKNGTGIKLVSLIKKGVPESIRPQLWKKLLDIEVLKSTSALFKYQEYADGLRQQLVALGVTEFNSERAERTLASIEMEDPDVQHSDVEPSIQNLRQIFLDVGRTFPTHVSFFGDRPCAIESKAILFRVLGVYAKYNPSVGYCQGMSFIAGMLVLHLPEEEAFWCLVALLQKPKYLQGYFDDCLERVQRHACVFDWLLKKKSPDLWGHLHSYNLDPLMYVTPWFMCLFTSLPCWDCVLAIWDLMFLEGAIVVFRVALAVMESIKPLLMDEKDANGLIILLQKLPAKKVTREVLLPIIWKTDVQWWEIEQIQALINETKDKDQINVKVSPLTKRKRNKGTLAEKFKKNDANFLRKIARMFNAKHSVPASITMTKNLPEVIVTPPTPVSFNDINKKSKKQLYKKFKASSQQLDSICTCNDISNHTTSSVFENVSRVNRLATGMKGQSRSIERLEEVVDSLVGCGASQRLAFEEFTHQIPLRIDNIQNQSIGSSSEKELNSLSNFKSPSDVSLKRKRLSSLSSSSFESDNCYSSLSSLSGLRT